MIDNDKEPVFKIDETGITINKPIAIMTKATPYENYVCGKNLLEPQKDKPKLAYVMTYKDDNSFFSWSRGKYAIGKTLPRKWVKNGPATILFWEDGTKTIVKCNQDDEFDAQKGYLMAYFEKWTGLSKHQIAKILEEIK